MKTIALIVFTAFIGLGHALPVNPCEALKLPLCRVKSDFAAEHGIEVKPRPTTTPRTVQAKETKEDNEPVIDIRQRLAARRKQQQESDDRENGNDACAGLIFCKLSKDVPASKRRPKPRRTTTPTPEVPDIPDDFFHEDLMSAVLNGNIETAKQLIEDGANVNAEDVHGNSVLHIAAQNGRTEVIDDLLLKGAEVNKGNNHKNTALHLAAQNGWTEIARKLLRHRKIAVDAADLHANTALHLAAQNGQLGVLQLLLEAGANVNKHNTHKHTPLHLAAQNGHLELSRVLVKNGADPNYPDLIGNTPLHTAYHTTHREIAKMLIENGADPNKANLSGLKPFQLTG